MTAIKPTELQEFENRKRPQYCWDCEMFNRGDENCAEYGKVPKEVQSATVQCEQWLWIPF